MISIVTGGCGFIGSHMVDRLLAEGHEVRVIDNWTTGRPENLNHQKDNSNLTVYHMDIRNKEEIKPIFKDVDYVFHFAALADIVPSIQKPQEYYTSNVLGTFHVVECAKEEKKRSWFMQLPHPVMVFRMNSRRKNPQKSGRSIRMH